MTKLGNIKFNDYNSDDDINQNIYASSSDNYKYKNVRKIDLDCKKKSCNKTFNDCARNIRFTFPLQ